jgi:hypothetical protein
MGPEDILLRLREPDGDGIYRFSCPGCLDTVEKPADPRVVALLLSAGVEVDEVDGTDPMEDGRDDPAARPDVVRPETHQGGPPLTVEDLMRFRELLRDEERLYQAIPRD